MNANQAAAQALSDTARSRRAANIDAGIQSMLQGIRQSAEAGQFRVNFQIPRDYVVETVKALKGLEYDVQEVGAAGSRTAQAELCVSWFDAALRQTAMAEE